MSRSCLGIINHLHFYQVRKIDNSFIKTIQLIVVYITHSNDVRWSWHWMSSQILILILIGPWHYFIEVKLLVMVFTSWRRKPGRKFSFKSKNRRRITVNSHCNSSETNNYNTSNSDDVIENSNLPCIKVHTKFSLNKLIALQKKLIHSHVLESMMKWSMTTIQVNKYHVYMII